MLLLHAGVNDQRSWQHVVERLSPSHRCVAYDARGYGETTYEREHGWSPVADAVAVLDAAGIDRAIVIACSMGGKTAIDLTLAHPERVSRLVLIGAAVRGTPFDAETELDTQSEVAYEAGDFDECGRLEAWQWLDGPTAPEGRVTGPARELFLEMNDRALRAEDPGDQAEAPAAWPRLGEIAVPALVLLGRLDVEWIQQTCEGATDLIPGARLQWLEGVAHVPHLEGDPATLDAIEAFVRLSP